MASKKPRSNPLANRTSRQALAVSGKPYWLKIRTGIFLGYRRLDSAAGSWSLRVPNGVGKYATKAIGTADDQCDADGLAVLSYDQAADRAIQLATGSKTPALDGIARRKLPLTVGEAIAQYKAMLIGQGRNKGNATKLDKHVPKALRDRLVADLTRNELRDWRDSLRGLAPATVNRTWINLAAALNLVAEEHEHLNCGVWKLKAVPVPDGSHNNIVLTEPQVRAVVAAAYKESQSAGLWMEMHAITGARSSQIALLDVRDLIEINGQWCIRIPSSLKGREGRQRSYSTLPIPNAFADRLQVSILGREPTAPLLLRFNIKNKDGRRWTTQTHTDTGLFGRLAASLNLPAGATMYCLRHTSITRHLLLNTPIRLVARAHDTSVEQIEQTYSRNIVDHGQDLLLAGLPDFSPGEVIKLKRRRA